MSQMQIELHTRMFFAMMMMKCLCKNVFFKRMDECHDALEMSLFISFFYHLHFFACHQEMTIHTSQRV